MKEHTLTKGSVGKGILLFVCSGGWTVYRKTGTGSDRFRAYAI